VREAEKELRALQKANPDSEVARVLLGQIQSLRGQVRHRPQAGFLALHLDPRDHWIAKAEVLSRKLLLQALFK
jgi:hypothetical protein